jgi:hypothetical protein
MKAKGETRFAVGSFAVGSIRNRSQESVESLRDCAGMDLCRLIDMASEGNKKAMKALHRILVGIISQFGEICDGTPEVFEPIARKTSFWPGFLTCDADIKNQNAALVATLNLGRDAELNYSGKQWSRGTPETCIALELYGVVNAYRESWSRRGETRLALQRFKKRFPGFKRPTPPPPPKQSAELAAALAKQRAEIDVEFSLYDDTYNLAKKLQPLSRKNYPQWFEAAWPAFLGRWKKDFENRKCFAGYWRSPTYKEDTTSGKQLKSNARALIRDAIKKKIKQSFRSIAPKVV